MPFYLGVKTPLDHISVIRGREGTGFVLHILGISRVSLAVQGGGGGGCGGGVQFGVFLDGDLQLRRQTASAQIHDRQLKGVRTTAAVVS